MTFVSGNPVAGCCQEICMDPGVFVEAGNGGISPSAGWHPIAPSGSLTVSAAPATRPCAGWIFAGTTNFFDETPSMTYVLDDCPTGALLDAFYTTDWYVDATKVDDSGTASTPGMAKKTFAGLFATGLVLAGDTVHAAEGLYEDGVMYRPEATDGNARVYAVGSRVIVPSGVTILADGRVSETVIKGASATSVANEYGLGPDAVRCVSLYPNAKIKGFTLTGGRTDSNTAVGEQKAKEYPDNIGALVHGIETSSSGSAKLQVAEDCVLANGVARRAGGASFANLIRCRVTDVRGIDSTGNGSATLRCYHSGTVVDDVKGGYAVMYPYTFISSTVRASVYPGFYNPYSLSGVKCSILDCSGSVTSGSTGKFVNTYLAVKLTNMTDENLDETSMIVGYDALEMDDECRPVVGKNVAIDKGSGAVYDAFRAEIGEKDATGVPRVMNGAIDIGAIEADWRPVYARDVTRSGRFEVTDVTSNVVETSEKTVGIGPNGVLLSAWTNTQVQEYTVRVKVSGTSAKIRFGDDERLVTASSEVQTLNFKGMPPISRLVLDNTGNDGVLEFLETKRLCGVILVVR